MSCERARGLSVIVDVNVDVEVNDFLIAAL